MRGETGVSSLPPLYVLVSEVLSTQVRKCKDTECFLLPGAGDLQLRSLSMPTTLPILLNQTAVSVIYCL